MFNIAISTILSFLVTFFAIPVIIQVAKEKKLFEVEQKEVKKRQPKEEYTVEAILRHRSKKGKLYLFTKYKNIDTPSYQRKLLWLFQRHYRKRH